MKALFNQALYYFDPVSDQILIKVGHSNLKNGSLEWTLVDSTGRIIDLGPAHFREVYDKAVMISRDQMGTTVVPMAVNAKTVKIKNSPFYFQTNSERVKDIVKAEQVAMWQKYKVTVKEALANLE